MPTYTDTNGIIWNFTTYVNPEDGNTYASIGNGKQSGAFIGGLNFSGAISIPSIVKDDSTRTEYTVQEIGAESFENYKTLQGVTIPDTVKTIANEAFKNCYALASVIIPDLVETIGDYAFYQCSMTTLTIGVLVETIGDYAFKQCPNLENLMIGQSVVMIGVEAFQDCIKLRSVTIPYSVTSIQNYAFRGCSILASITIGNSVQIIGQGAFQDCIQLIAVTIPDSVTTIYQEAFSHCVKLRNLTIGKAVTTIGSSAFGSSGLETVIIANGQVISGTTFSSPATNVSFFGATVTTERPSINQETINGIIWNFTTYVDNYGNNYASINGGATTEGTALSGSIIIPHTVTNNAGTYTVKKIGIQAFKNNNNLQGVIISNTVTTIDVEAFKGCSSLTDIVFESDSQLQTIEDSAFFQCAITTLTIPNLVISIGHYAFYYCPNLKIVTIGNSVEIIEDFAFSSCIKLEKLTIGNSVREIRNSAFSSCNKLESLIIPNLVETIGINAFSWCQELKIVTIGTLVTTIGENTFYRSDKLDTVIIANGQEIAGITTPEVAIPSPATGVYFFGTTVNTQLPPSAPAPAPTPAPTPASAAVNILSFRAQRFFLPNIRMTFIRSNNHYYKPHTAYGRVGASCGAGNLCAVRRRT